MNLLNLFQKLDDYISYLNSNTVNEKSLLSKALGNKISLIDVGSNYGSYLSFISNNFSIEKAFVFEPSKTNYQYLKNKFKKFNYIIKPYATSNKNNKRMFYQYEITSMSSLYPDLKTYNSFNKIKNKYLVKVIKLDDFIKVKKLT